MHGNTPPHVQDIQDDDVEGEGDDLVYSEDEDDNGFDDFEEIEERDLESILDHEDIDSEIEEMDSLNDPVPELDDSILTFNKHKSAVFCCSFHPTNSLVATGGEDDCAYVWDKATGEVIYKVLNHSDTLITSEFSFDGNYLATGDLSGTMQVFKCNTEIKKVWEYCMGDMSWLRWHRAAYVLMAANETGDLYIWRMPSGQCKVIPSNGHKCESGELTSDGQKLYCGYFDGTVKLWDIKNLVCITECLPSHPNGHQNNVTAVSCDSNSPLYASGCQDGKILFMTNNGPSGSVDIKEPIEALAFSPHVDFKVVASGSIYGNISVWDPIKAKLRVACDHPAKNEGITTLRWLSNYVLIVGTILGGLIAYDARDGVQKFSLHGHLGEIYDIKYKPEEHIVMTASEDKKVKIFNVHV